MANPTSNFGWQMPTNTDLVKDLPADFEVFGQAVDTSLMDLKGGTTGQVLSKASNTDMDFTWVSDATGIPATIFDAKGDIIAATAADTAARLAVGTNGQVLTADSSTATGLKWGSASSNLTLSVVASGSMPSATSLSITGLTQDYLMLRLSSIAAGSSDDLTLQFNSNSNNIYNYVAWNINTSALGRDFNAGDNRFYLTVTDSNLSGNNSWIVEIKNCKANGFHTVTIMGAYPNSAGVNVGFVAQGYFEDATQITSIQINTPGNQTFSGGTYELIGG